MKFVKWNTIVMGKTNIIVWTMSGDLVENPALHKSELQAQILVWNLGVSKHPSVAGDFPQVLVVSCPLMVDFMHAFWK